MQESRISDEELLRNLESSFEEVYKDDKESKHELMKAMGYDPEEFVKRGLKKVKEFSAQQRISLAGRLWEKFQAIVEDYPDKFQNDSGTELRTKLESALSGPAGAPALEAFFRDLSSLEDDDLRTILGDSGILDELDSFLEPE